MKKKFNFLARRTGLGVVTADLRKKYPKKSDQWIAAEAQAIMHDRSLRDEHPGSLRPTYRDIQIRNEKRHNK
jgi:hypothetical protein